MIVVLTGAGISKESGIATFRDSDGLWANYRIEEVCTPEALARDRAKVIGFYNERRKELLEKQPNAAHYALVELAKVKDVRIITQNIDDLHELAGSKDVIHLHGEMCKLRSSRDELATVDIEGWRKRPDAWRQDMDTCHPDGTLLRPYVVFFGEGVPMMDEAVRIAQQADVFVIIGSSLNVYPAASLANFVRPNVPIYIVDPADPANVKSSYISNPITYIQKKASEGVPELVEKLKKQGF